MMTPGPVLFALFLASQQGTTHTDAYVELASRFTQATANDVTDVLRTWPRARVEHALEDLHAQNRITPRMMLMETHTALRLLRAETFGLSSLSLQQMMAARFHLRLAAKWSATPRVARGAPEFYQPFYLLLTALLQNLWDLPEAISLLEAARRTFPLNPDLAFGLGCVYEAAASAYGSAMSSTLDQPWPGWLRNRSRSLDRAAESFTEVLLYQPSQSEARLRLGRVLALHGQRTPARTQLARARAESQDPFVQDMAAMFLGRISQAEGRLDEAAAFYREAASRFPQAQAALVALSHVLEAGGDRPAAAQSLETMMESKPEKSEQDDPWWQYHFAQTRHAAASLAQAWKAAFP